MSFYKNCIQVCKKEFKFKYGRVKIQLIKSEYNSVPEDLLDQFAFVELNENYSDKNKKRFIAEINIRHEECESFYKEYPEFYKSTNERFGNFLKYTAGLELNSETNFLMLLLHEYRHIAQLNELYKYNQDIN